MADHKSFLRDLPPDVRASLTRRRNGPGLWRLAGHVGLIAALAGLVAAGWTFLMLPLGIVLIFLFTLLHEVSHDTVFRTLRLNRIVAIVAGFILVLPPTWFRYFHFAHHKHTHDPDHDPELANPKPATRAQFYWHVSGAPVWKSMLTTLLRNAIARVQYDYLPSRQNDVIQTEARLMIAGYVALAILSFAIGSALLLWIWIVPLILGQPFLRLYLLAEHTLCPHSDDMFKNTRTTLTTRAIRWLAWNMPYHAEHHAFPGVPFHQLPALHDLARDHLRETADGYTGFHATLRAQL